MQRLLRSFGASGLLFLPACGAVTQGAHQDPVAVAADDLGSVAVRVAPDGDSARPELPTSDAGPDLVGHRDLHDLVSRRDNDHYTGLRQGDWDITLTGSGSNNDQWNAGAAAIALGAGFMLNDTLELSVRQLVSMDNPSGSETHWNGATRAALDLHIPIDQFYPFVGANFGRVYGGSVTDAFTCAPEAGVKWFLKPDAYLLAMAEYQLLFDDFDDVDEAWNDGAFVYTLGFGLRF